MQYIKIYLPCNFEVNPITHFDRLCKLEKRGDEILKKSSPQKPLGQLQPNFGGMAPFQYCVRRAQLPTKMATKLKIEHMVKLHVFGNNSKPLIISEIWQGEKLSAQQDLTTLKFWRKSDYLSWSYCPFFIKFSKCYYFSFFISKTIRDRR